MESKDISLRLKHYNEAYMKQNVDEHKNEALEQALRNRLGHVDRDVDIIHSDIPPRRYDMAIKEAVEHWPGKDETPPRRVATTKVEGSA